GLSRISAAASPSAADTTSKPQFVRFFCRSCRETRWSSAMRIRWGEALMRSFSYLSNRDGALRVGKKRLYICFSALPGGANCVLWLPFFLMKVSDLRGILQYVPRFREKIFVVALDGEIVASPNFGNILLDLAVLRSLSIKVILVHGAGQQIAQLAAERGVTI